MRIIRFSLMIWKNTIRHHRFRPMNLFAAVRTLCGHGFRYIEISGIKNPSLNDVSGVFVHQAVKTRTGFECSDERINKLFKAGQNATLSNLFYMPTDCPTREKLGWANDAQSSTEQMLINFETERVFEKWLTDIHDAMREDGALPGIIPTAGWGYHWGNGPVSDGVLFEIPYRLYFSNRWVSH